MPSSIEHHGDPGFHVELRASCQPDHCYCGDGDPISDHNHQWQFGGRRRDNKHNASGERNFDIYKAFDQRE